MLLGGTGKRQRPESESHVSVTAGAGATLIAPKPTTLGKAPGMAPGKAAAAAAAAAPPPAAAATTVDSSTAPIAVVVIVPEDEVGRIIGAKGSAIKAFTKESGVLELKFQVTRAGERSSRQRTRAPERWCGGNPRALWRRARRELDWGGSFVHRGTPSWRLRPLTARAPPTHPARRPSASFSRRICSRRTRSAEGCSSSAPQRPAPRR